MKNEQLYIASYKSHIVKRYVQRFKKDKHIETLLKTPPFGRSFDDNKKVRNLLEEMKALFNECKETKCYLNNPKSLLYLYDRYGYEDYHFYHNYNIIFVTKRINGKYHGVTCFDFNGDTAMFQNISTVKFTKKHKQKTK